MSSWDLCFFFKLYCLISKEIHLYQSFVLKSTAALVFRITFVRSDFGPQAAQNHCIDVDHPRNSFIHPQCLWCPPCEILPPVINWTAFDFASTSDLRGRKLSGLIELLVCQASGQRTKRRGHSCVHMVITGVQRNKPLWALLKQSSGGSALY